MAQDDTTPHVSCDACGQQFEAFYKNQAEGLDTGRTSDGTVIGGNYGSKYDCCHFTIADPAGFPGDNICDACLDAMLADGRIVDPRDVCLATGEEVPWAAGDEVDLAVFFEEIGDGRRTVEGTYKGVLYRLTVGPTDSGSVEELEAYLAEIECLIDDKKAEAQDQARDRFYEELRDQHARSVAAGGPSQRMKDALALYKRTVVSSVGLHSKETPDVQS